METDRPIKVLFERQGQSLLPFIGEHRTNVRVTAVESVELPVPKRTIDSVLRLERDGLEEGHQDAGPGHRTCQGPPEVRQGDVAMSEKLELVRGSGNVFRDFGHEDADREQLRAILAAEIIKTLDREGLSVRRAHSRTGIAAADFSRIRNADLGRFTVDRLMSIINRLGSRVDVRVRVRRTRTTAQGVPA